MKRWSTVLVALLGLAGCALAAAADEPQIGSDTEETKQVAKAPIPLLMQFDGSYTPKTAVDAQGPFKSLSLKPNGKYNAKLSNGKSESGVYYGPSKPQWPLKIVFISTGVQFKTTLESGDAYSGEMVITRGKATVRLSAHLTLTHEDLCTDSGGTWLDDDSNSDWLYCACEGKAFIPAYGGCVEIP